MLLEASQLEELVSLEAGAEQGWGACGVLSTLTPLPVSHPPLQAPRSGVPRSPSRAELWDLVGSFPPRC